MPPAPGPWRPRLSTGTHPPAPSPPPAWGPGERVRIPELGPSIAVSLFTVKFAQSVKFTIASTIQRGSGQSSFTLLASPSPSLFAAQLGSTSPCVSGCLLQMARVSQRLSGGVSPSPPTLSLPSLHLRLCLSSSILWVSASPSDSVLHLCVSLSPTTSWSPPSVPARGTWWQCCLTSEQQPTVGPSWACPTLGPQSPDWDEAAKGKGREKESRLPRFTQWEEVKPEGLRLAADEPELDGGASSVLRAWGQASGLHSPARPFLYQAFPLELVSRLGPLPECPSPDPHTMGCHSPIPPPGALPETPAEIATAPPSVPFCPLYSQVLS